MLDNLKATRVKRASALLRKKDRLHAQRFLVEGPQAVRELLTKQWQQAQHLFFSLDGTASWQAELLALATAHQVPYELATPEVLAVLSDTVHPQGVVAIAKMPPPPPADMLDGAQLVAILHEIRDPGNAGTVLRAADAAGADAVIFAGASIDPWHPKVVRATCGSLFHLPVLHFSTLQQGLALARQAGLITVAADVCGELLGAQDSLLKSPLAWVFGNEARGLSAQQRAEIGLARKLPIYGAAESLNLASAASVLLYQTAFAQRA